MRSVNKLRGTRIYINEDLCPASQAIRRAQLPLLKQAKSNGKVAYFRGTKLIIKDRQFNQNFAFTSGNQASHAPGGTASHGSSRGGVAEAGVSVEADNTNELPTSGCAARAGDDGPPLASGTDRDVDRASATDKDVGRATSPAAALGSASGMGVTKEDESYTKRTIGSHWMEDKLPI